jgi:hypothetical protein
LDYWWWTVTQTPQQAGLTVVGEAIGGNGEESCDSNCTVLYTGKKYSLTPTAQHLSIDCEVRKATPISRNFSISRREIDRPHKNATEKFQKVLCENVAISPPISHLTAAKRPVTPRESSVDDCDGPSMTAERYSTRPSQHG